MHFINKPRKSNAIEHTIGEVFATTVDEIRKFDNSANFNPSSRFEYMHISLLCLLQTYREGDIFMPIL
jgi:hypothetical protein